MIRLKAGWVMIALLAPEIVVYTAISQLYAAWRLKRRLRELFGDDDDNGLDLTYRFFVVMGGVQVPNVHPTQRVQHPFLPVSPETMLWLAKLGYRIAVGAKRIRDKSKADTIQKCLVPFQTTWMAVQCIARRLLGLPLTLLEVHTMVHVLCAAIMYGFWLKVGYTILRWPAPSPCSHLSEVSLLIRTQKPLDVREPERADPAGWEDALALLSERAFPTEQRDFVVVPGPGYQHDDARPVSITPPAPTREELQTVMDRQRKADETYRDRIYNRARTRRRSSTDTTPAFREVTIEWIRPTTAIQLGAAGPGRPARYLASTVLAQNQGLPCGLINLEDPIFIQDIGYWDSLVRGLEQARGLDHPSKRATAAPVRFYQTLYRIVPKPMLDTSNLQFPLTDLLVTDHYPTSQPLRARQLYVAMLLPALYGGIHLTALGFDFPSPVEERLWLYAGVYIAIGLPIWEVVAWFLIIYEATDVLNVLLRPCLWWYDGGRGAHRSIVRNTRKLLGRMFLLGYALARAYIIVESFASLRHLPIGVFWTPDWLQMIPHV